MNALQKKKAKSAIDKKKTVKRRKKRIDREFDIEGFIRYISNMVLTTQGEQEDGLAAILRKFGSEEMVAGEVRKKADLLDVRTLVGFHYAETQKKYDKRNWKDHLVFWEKGYYPFHMQYINQPNGEGQNPDILFFLHGCCIPIDAKSTARGSAMWNSTYPHDDVVYCIGSTKDQQTAIVMGSEITPSKKDTKIIEDYFSDVSALRHGANEKLTKSQKFKVNKIRKGWGLYPRKMVENHTIYIRCPEREQWEQEVIDKITDATS